MSKILIKRSAVADKVPTTTDLDLGELAINTNDGKLYLKKNVSGSETIVEVGRNSAVSEVATKLMVGRTINMTGDITWTSDPFDGSENVTGVATLATVNGNIGTFGSNASVPVIKVNAKGLITEVSTADLGSIAVQNASEVAIVGGNINNTSIGGTTPSTGSFTSIATTNNAVIGGNLSVNGDIVVNGSTTTVNTSSMTVQDPIISLGGQDNDAALNIDDAKDRGIAFRWHNGTTAKIGFFGFDRSTGKFTFIPDATITNDVVSGSVGSIDANINGTSTTVSGTVAIANGGTGATTVADARTNLGIPSTTGSGASGTWPINISGNAATANTATTATTATNVSGTVAVTSGGTGATTAEAACVNLSAARINPTTPKAGDVKVVAGVISIHDGTAWRQVFPAVYS